MENVSKKIKNYLSILNINSIIKLEENNLDYWHQKRFIEIQKSFQDKHTISELLIELNNAKDYLDKFDISTLNSLFKIEEKNQRSPSQTFNKKDLGKEIQSEEKYYFMQDYGKREIYLNKSRISQNEAISKFVGLIFFSGFICLVFGYYLKNEIALEKLIKSLVEFDLGSTVVFLLFILICVLGIIECKKFIKKKGKNFFNLNK